MYRQPYIATLGGRSMRSHAPSPYFGFRASEPIRQQVPARVLPIIRATGGTYLGEDEHYYYWMEPAPNDQLGGMFDNIGNMFKRMVKFTPNSFKPANIYEGFVNTTLTVATGGAYQLLPKNLKKSVYDVGKYAIPVVAGGVLAYTAGPAVWSMLQPKLTAAAGILGKGVGTITGLFKGKGGQDITGKGGQDITGKDYGGMTGQPTIPGVTEDGAPASATIGGALFELLGRLPQHKQAEVAERLTPQDIAYMETHGQIPPHLRGYFDSMAQQTFNPPLPPGSGSAALYDAYGQAPPEPVQAGLFGEMNPLTIGLLIGVPAVFLLFQRR